MATARTLMLTRPQAQGAAFADVLNQRLPGRFRCVIAPLLRIAPVAGALDLTGAQALIFSSANGVEQFAARSAERGLTAYCVGDMTAQAAQAAGMTARSADGDVQALARMVIAAHRPGSGHFVHVRGRHAAGDLLGDLHAAGVPARAAEIYDQIACPLPRQADALLLAGGADALAFFSPRTSTVFARQAREAGWPLASAVSVALSPAADAALAPLNFAARVIAETPTREGMIKALSRL